VGTPGANGLGSLMQGFVETSNVNVVQELITMIQTQRAYEMNSKADPDLRPDAAKARPTVMKRSFALLPAALAATWLLAGCQTLRQAPQVDIVEAPAARPAVRPRPVAAPTTGSLFHSASYRPASKTARALVRATS
jgi:hypothetical protein